MSDLKNIDPAVIRDVGEVAKALPPKKDDEGHYARWGQDVCRKGSYALLKHYFHVPDPLAKVGAELGAYSGTIAIAAKCIDRKNDAKKKPSPPPKTGPNCAM